MDLSHDIVNQNILVITPKGESLDAKEARSFKEKAFELILANNGQSVILDFRNLQFIDSSGLGSLLSILRLINSRNKKLKLCEIKRPIQSMFELVSMHKIFDIYPTIHKALDSSKPLK